VALKIVEIPPRAVVVMVGASGSGKSTFVRQHFSPTEILSSDFFRGMVSDDENDQSASRDAFEILYSVLDRRLRRGRVTVIDATSVRAEDRAKLLAVAAKYQAPAIAIVLRTPVSICLERNSTRPGRTLDPAVIKLHLAELESGLDRLTLEGFSRVHTVTNDDDVEMKRIAAPAAGGPVV
jgi:predicted kinase